MTTEQKTSVDIESQEMIEHESIGKCKKIGCCVITLILMFGVGIGMYTFVMLKNPLKLIK